MGHTSRIMENNAEGNLSCGGPVQEVSEGKNISKWPRDHSCDNCGMNVAAFCPCPKNLSEANLKSFELMTLAGEISKQPSVM